MNWFELFFLSFFLCLWKLPLQCVHVKEPWQCNILPILYWYLFVRCNILQSKYMQHANSHIRPILLWHISTVEHKSWSNILQGWQTFCIERTSTPMATIYSRSNILQVQYFALTKASTSFYARQNRRIWISIPGNSSIPQNLYSMGEKMGTNITPVSNLEAFIKETRIKGSNLETA